MNNKIKGFTLIELLAVIVILAIIALIIMPIITGVIKNAKDSSDLRSAEAYIKAGENYYAKASTSGGTLDSNVIDDLEVSSNKATDGSSVVVNSDGTTDMAIIIDDKCYRKTFSESIKDIKVTDITTEEDKANCSVPVRSDYAFLKQNAFNTMIPNGKSSSIMGLVKSISKVDNIPTSYTYSWDISDTDIVGNTSIMAYAVGNDTDKYDLYLVSSKPIASPTDSHYLLQLNSLSNTVDLSWLNTYFTTNMYSILSYIYTGDNLSLKLGNNFDTSNVTDMNNMFSDSKFASLDLGSKFATSNVTDMSYMFYYLSSIENIDLGDKFDTSNVTDMNHMFSDSKFVSLDLGSKFATSNVTDMSYMFSSLSSIENIDLGDNFDTSNVTDMNHMFFATGKWGSSSVTLNLGNKFDTSKVVNMSYMFGQSPFTTLDLKDKFNTENVEDMSYIFNETELLTTVSLGPAFKNIPSNSTYAFYVMGKENACTIKVSSDIFYDSTHFKLNKDSNTTIANTSCTIVSTY